MSIGNQKAESEATEYEENRSHFTVEQLLPYEGQWVAFSLDGQRIVAAAPDLLELDRRIREAGEDPQNVGLECVHFADYVDVGGVQFNA